MGFQRLLVGIGLFFVLAEASVAHAEEPRPARIPVRIVAGKLVVSCDLATRIRRIPAHLFVEFENPCGLQLHTQAARGIRTENRDGTTNPITIHLPDLEIGVEFREEGPDRDYDRFTRLHSPDLSEIALVGTIGGEILRNYHLVLDLAHGTMELSAPRERAEEPRKPAEGESVVSFSLVDPMVWLPVRYEDGKPAAILFGTAHYDTLLRGEVARRFGKPAGDIGSLRLGDLDLSRYVALRPETLPISHPDGAAGITGLNLLRHLRVEVDRVNRAVRIKESAPADFPVADLAFFQVRVERGGDPVEAFLTEHPEARLNVDAADLLLRRRLEEGAPSDTLARALRWIHDVRPEDLRTTVMLMLLDWLSERGYQEAAVVAGKLGIESGRKDRYPDSVHKIHGRIGRILLERKEMKEAWRHLLSAAFGMPQDGMVNLGLGHYYEEAGRLRRAFSRYVQAVIQPESGPEAIAGLKRVQEKLGGERFSVDLVAKMIAGKVLSFGTATKYEPEEGQATGHVALVEFFTNGHYQFAIGGALANEGLQSHFPAEHVAFLTYHLPPPELTPLVNELGVSTASTRNVGDPVVHLVNGVESAPGAGRPSQREEIYEECRQAVLQALRSETKYTIELSAGVEKGVLSGETTVRGPAREDLELHVILAERAVLFPGRSKTVIHRMVARGSLTGSHEGVKFAPAEGRMSFSFSRSLADVTRENEEYLDALESIGSGSTVRLSMEIDPAQVVVVAYLRDTSTGRILQAARTDATWAEEEER